MKNKEYWRKRFELLEESQNQRGIQCYHEIEKQYRRAQKEIEGKLSAWYMRLADNNGISLQAARKMITGRELEEFKWDVNEYIRHGQENAVNHDWMKQLENASARYHISRLEAVKIQMQQSLEVMFGNQLDSIDSAMRYIYTEGYYRTAFEIQKGFGIGWDFATLDERKISKAIHNPWASDGKDFSERIWGNRQKLAGELNRELTRNIILSQDPQKAIDTIARKMNTSKNNAGRLVMTEEAFFSSAAQKDCFAELDVEQFEIVATLDSHTSDICREMDGKHFPMSQWEAGVTAPPFHVWCRSTTVPFFDDEFDSAGERAARGEDGKTYYVPAGMTYKDWKKAFVEGDKAEVKPTVPDGARFQNKKMQDDYKTFMEKLAHSDGEKPVVKKLMECAKSANYVKDENSRAAFMYNMRTDAVIYNPDAPYYEEYDMEFVQAHELSHRMDALLYRSWENEKFASAIEKCSRKVYDDKDEIEEWFSVGGKYDLDMALSDIISALSRGDMNDILCAGHEKEYWENNPDYICMEIFANIASIDVMDYGSRAEFHGLLQEIYAAYKEMVTIENENTGNHKE